MPTYEHQDSVWAYHFYRLIERASHVSLLYDTRSNGLQTGEVSRFVHQLHYHYEVPMRDKLVVYNVSSSKTPPLAVPKREDIMRRLDAYRKGGSKAISASAINTYLDCPLKFYFSVVEGIREEEEVSETIESDVFGSILHKVMEELYKPFQGKMVTVDLLKAIRKDTALLTGVIARAFASEFFKTEVVRSLTGQNYLIGEMIRKYVEKILERDGKLTPFVYIESERKINGLISLSDHSEIRLKGFIDRVDERNGLIRIVDYKTGRERLDFKSVTELFDPSEKDRKKAIMQVLFYCKLYKLDKAPMQPLQPSIYIVRNLFDKFESFLKYDKEPLTDFNIVEKEFDLYLTRCLEDIFDLDKPFSQTTVESHCKYCDFKQLCKR